MGVTEIATDQIIKVEETTIGMVEVSTMIRKEDLAVMRAEGAVAINGLEKRITTVDNKITMADKQSEVKHRRYETFPII